MKTQKFKVCPWERTTLDEINIKEQIFLALSDKRYLNLLSRNAKDAVIEAMSFDQYKKFLKKNKMYGSDSGFKLKTKKQRELKNPKFSVIKTDPEKALHQALNLLNTAFTLNKNVKKKAYEYETCFFCGGDGCGCCGGDGVRCNVDYDLRGSEYREKTKIIKKVINLIKNNNLPIKYGKNDGVVYFEYLGSQVSFHDPKNEIKNCKRFKGIWTGVRNKKIPFILTKTP